MDERTLDIIEETESTETGNIKIAQDVVATIAGMAANSIEGIAGMSGGISDGIAQILSNKKQLTKGVKVDIYENRVEVDLFVTVKYGYNIAAVAAAVQKEVKENIENMTGMNVALVNVNVQGIEFPKPEPEVKEEVVEPEVEVVEDTAE